MTDANSYLICGVPRSGGSWLCEALRATGVAGVPREYFMPAFSGSESLDVGVAGFEASAWARERGLRSFPEFLAAVLAEGRTRNGVFAASLQWSSFEPLLEKLRIFTPYGGTARIRPLLRRYFGPPRFVYLVRRDRVRQAVSWALAHQTGRYTSTQPGSASAGEPHYDPELLDALLARIQAAEAGWESLFDLLEAEPLRLVYEDWSRDLRGTVERILRWLELPADAAGQGLRALRHEPLATAQNDEWTERYQTRRASG